MRRLLRCRPRRPHSLAMITLLIFFVVIFLFLIRHNNVPTLIEVSKSHHPKSIHFMCILIPFRDRFEELTEFVPRITQFLERQNIRHKIFVINQVRYQEKFLLKFLETSFSFE